MVLLYVSEYFTTLGYFLAELSKNIRIWQVNFTNCDDISNVILSLVVKQLNSCFLQQLITLLLQAKNTKNLVFGSSSRRWVFYNNCTTFLPATFLPMKFLPQNFSLYFSKLQLKLPNQIKNYDPWHLSPFRDSFESKISKLTQ